MTNPKDPASVAKFLAKGDSSNEPLFLEVGRALTNWEGLEYALSELYQALLNANGDGAVAGYGYLVASSSRSMLLKAAEEHFPFRDDGTFAEIRSDLSLVGRLSARRNEIAHGIVAHLHGKGFYLVPAWYNTTKAPRTGRADPKYNDGIGTYAYTSEQVKTYGEHFKSLREKLHLQVRPIWRRWGTV